MRLFRRNGGMNPDGRFPRTRAEGAYPQERNWTVQRYTGYATSTVPAGQWDRGVLYRGQTPTMAPSRPPLYMNDPTNPARFVYVPGR